MRASSNGSMPAIPSSGGKPGDKKGFVPEEVEKTTLMHLEQSLRQA